MRGMMERTRQMVSLSRAGRGSKAAPRPQGPRIERGRGKVPPDSAKEAKVSFLNNMLVGKVKVVRVTRPSVVSSVDFVSP